MAVNLKQVPDTPGIYKFFSKNKIIYIGKAKNLKKRVSSYFGKSFKDRKTQQIKFLTDKVETFSTTTEAEALLLEQSLIKENLLKRQSKYEAELDVISKRLSNKSFVDRAPKNIVDQEKNNYNELQKNIDKISITVKGL